MYPAGRVVTVSIVLVLAACFPAHAQSDTQDLQSQAQTPAAAPKNPPPPLFPKHRRGLYRNAQGLEVIDATPQSPPLETDDPTVPDKGEYEINLMSRADLSKDAQSFDLLLVDANYGMLPTIAGHEIPTQVKFECPLAAAHGSDTPFTVGVGAATVGLKFNFFNNEHKGIAVSAYPQFEFAMPGGDRIEKALAETGQTLILPLLVSKEFKYFTFVANGAVETPVRDSDRRETKGTTSLGVGRALTRKVAAMVELRAESAFHRGHDRLVVLNAGVMHGVRNIIMYAHLGRSLLSDDAFAHHYIGGGMKVLIEPRNRHQ